MQAAITSIFTVANLLFLGRGLLLTLKVAAITVFLATIIGTMLGLLRTYNKGSLGWIATAYIELFRNTPLILWIMAFRFLMPYQYFCSGITPLTCFTSAIIAEVVRGGLGAVPPQQHEAASAQGFSFVQTLWYIILPQCFRNILPALLSQVITVVKDSSFLWAVAVEEFTGKGMMLQGQFTTTTQVLLLYALLAATYFVVNFTLSLTIRRMSRGRRVPPSVQAIEEAVAA